MKKRFLLFTLIFVLLLVGCTEPTGESKVAEELLNAITIDSEFSTEFTLPTTVGENSTAITWESKDPTVLGADGYSYVQTEDKTDNRRWSSKKSTEKN